MTCLTGSNKTELSAISARLSQEIADAATPADIQKTLLEAKMRAEHSAVGDLHFVGLLIDAMAAVNAREPEEDIMLSFKEEWVASFADVEPAEELEEEIVSRFRMVAG